MTAPWPKAVLIGGPCDGIVLRLPDDCPPPDQITVLMPDIEAVSGTPAQGFAVVGTGTGKPISIAVPVAYVHRAGAFPDQPASRVTAYYPKDA